MDIEEEAKSKFDYLLNGLSVKAEKFEQKEEHQNFDVSKFDNSIAESDCLMAQINNNKDYLQELLNHKLNQPKNPQLSQITNYYVVSAVELYINHQDSKHASTDQEKCSICLCEFFDDITKLNLNDIVDDLKIEKTDQTIRLERCDGHFFHLDCIINYVNSQSSSSIKCPNCAKIYGIITGKSLFATCIKISR